MINEKVKELGIPQRSFSDEEIRRRLLFASGNGACKILEEGKAYRASDIDAMWLNGFGFPRYRGGLMYCLAQLPQVIGEQKTRIRQACGVQTKASQLDNEIVSDGAR
jgi:3-hydroxyacyl-CoA dehydrogenase